MLVSHRHLQAQERTLLGSGSGAAPASNGNAARGGGVAPFQQFGLVTVLDTCPRLEVHVVKRLNSEGITKISLVLLPEIRDLAREDQAAPARPEVVACAGPGGVIPIPWSAAPASAPNAMSMDSGL